MKEVEKEILKEEIKSERLEKEILKELKEEIHKTEELDKEIKDTERKLSRKFIPIAKLLARNGFTWSEVKILKGTMVQRVSRHRFLFTVIVLVGVVLVWKGLWETFDKISIFKYSAVSLVVGFLILWLLEKFSELK